MAPSGLDPEQRRRNRRLVGCLIAIALTLLALSLAYIAWYSDRFAPWKNR